MRQFFQELIWRYCIQSSLRIQIANASRVFLVRWSIIQGYGGHADTLIYVGHKLIGFFLLFESYMLVDFAALHTTKWRLIWVLFVRLVKLNVEDVNIARSWRLCRLIILTSTVIIVVVNCLSLLINDSFNKLTPSWRWNQWLYISRCRDSSTFIYSIHIFVLVIHRAIIW